MKLLTVVENAFKLSRSTLKSPQIIQLQFEYFSRQDQASHNKSLYNSFLLKVPEHGTYSSIIIHSAILVTQQRSDDAIVVQTERKLTLINAATPPYGRKTPELSILLIGEESNAKYPSKSRSNLKDHFCLVE